MSDLMIQVVAGIIVAIIVSLIGIGHHVRVSQSTTIPKTGKKIILLSVVAILVGAYYGGQSGWDMDTTQGIVGATIAGYGVLFFFIGKVVAWYQRN